MAQGVGSVPTSQTQQSVYGLLTDLLSHIGSNNYSSSGSSINQSDLDMIKRQQLSDLQRLQAQGLGGDPGHQHSRD